MDDKPRSSLFNIDSQNRENAVIFEVIGLSFEIRPG